MTAATTPTNSTITTLEKKIGVWFDPTHLILMGILAITVFAGVYLFESKSAALAQAKADQANQALIQAKAEAAKSDAQDAIIQQQNTVTIAQMKAANIALTAAYEKLTAANAQLAASLAVAQKNDATLAPVDQAKRWQVLEPRAIVAATPSGFDVDAPGGLVTIQDLEELLSDRTQIQNMGIQLTDYSKIITNDETALTSETKAHLSDILNDKAQMTSCQADLKKVNADFNAYKKTSRFHWLRDVGIALGIGFGFGEHFAK